MNKSYISNPESNPTRIYDLTLLKRIIAVQSKSSSFTKKGEAFDIQMSELIISSIKDISKLTGVEILVHKDTYGNIYAVKGESSNYPCVVSHIDTVHDIVKGRRVYQQNDTLFCFSDDLRKQVGTGGDDKVGIFVNLQALLDFDVIKAVFYRDEEIGHIGSKFSIKHERAFYSDCNFVLQCDRKGNTDFLAASGGYILCSEDFKNNVKPFTDKHGFNINNNGISTDVDTLVSEGIGVSCANISSGYFAPHTDKEVISVSDVGRTYSLVYDIIENLGNTKFEHEAKRLYSSSYWKKDNKKKNTKSTKHTPMLPLSNDLYRHRVEEEPNLPGMYQIKTPIRIPIQGMKCPDCNMTLVLGTVRNSLECPICKDAAEKHFMDWHETVKVTLTIDGRKRDYVFGIYDGAWVEKYNAIFVDYEGLKFWTSRELYEERWKEKKK